VPVGLHEANCKQQQGACYAKLNSALLAAVLLKFSNMRKQSLMQSERLQAKINRR
jgi:hypothetical protein